MTKSNLEMLQIVATGLGSMKDEMVFVGGAVAELYADNPAASDIRPTKDVDCVIALSSKSDHAKLEDELRKKGFLNDTSRGAPICRWIYKDIIVDVMPTDSDILGFSSIWYPEGVKNKVQQTLPDGQKIYIFPPAYYLASKFEAYKDRGGTDLRQSQDFEDIIYLLFNNNPIFQSISNSNHRVKTYLQNECKKLLQKSNLTEGIEAALQYEIDSESSEIILELIQKIADISL